MWARHKRRCPQEGGMTSLWRAAILLVLGLLAFCANESHAQSLIPYAARITGAMKYEDTAQALSVDNAGNVLVVGNYRSETVTVADTTTLTNSGPVDSADIFLARFRADGSLDWAASWGGDKDDIVVDVVVEPAGEFAYVVGVFKSLRMSFSSVKSEKNSEVMENIIFDEATLPSNVFIVKISSAGKVIWTTQTGDKNIASVSVDVALERVYITGTFPSYLLTSNDDENWERIDQWRTSAPDVDDDGSGESEDTVTEVNTFTDMEEKKSTDFWDEDPFARDDAEGGDDGILTDIYVDYYSTTTGKLVAGTIFTGEMNESATDLLLEREGEEGKERALVVAGFSESGDMRMAKNLNLRNTLEPNQGSVYGFVGKLDPTTMRMVWGKSLGVAAESRPLRLALDTTKRTWGGDVLYVVGTFGSPEMIALMKTTAGGIGSSTLPTLLRMDAATGKILWVRGLPQTQQVGVDQNGGLLVTGIFKGSTSFSYEIPNLVASSANGDLYLARIDAAANGTVIEVERFGGGSTGRYSVNDFQMDRMGNAYWAGNYTSGALTFASKQLRTPGSGNSDGFAGRMAAAVRTTTAAPTPRPPPSKRPTPAPTTLSPTLAPTTVEWAAAQALLTKEPTRVPTRRPTRVPTTRPTSRPTPSPPTRVPSRLPTAMPVTKNTPNPTASKVGGTSATTGMGLPADIQTMGTSAGNVPTAGGVGLGGAPTASVVDTSSTAALETGTNVDMVLTYAGQQSSILEFQRSLYQLMRPYATSYATFIPSSGGARRLQESFTSSSSTSSSSSSSSSSRALFFTELKRHQPSPEQQQQQQEPLGRFLSVNRCGDSRAARFSLPFFIEAKNKAATSKILGLLDDLVNGVLALDNGFSIFDNAVLCDVDYRGTSLSPLMESKTFMPPPQVVPVITTSGVSDDVEGAMEVGCQGKRGLWLGGGFVLGFFFLVLALGTLYGHHTMTQRRQRLQEASTRPAAREVGRQNKFFTALDLSPSGPASMPLSGGGSMVSSPELAQVIAQEKERYTASLAAERAKLAKEHEVTLNAAVAVAIAKEGDRLREEHTATLAAVRRSAAQGKGGVVLPGDKEKWEAEQEALISAAVAKEKEKWQLQQQQMAFTTGGGEGGGKEGGGALVEAVTAERNRLTQEHISLMTAAETKWQQAQEEAIAAALVAEKEKWEQGYADDVTAALQEEREKWEAEQQTALATQKQTLKLRYAAALTTEMEKWEQEKASLLASMEAAASGNSEGLTTAALLAEREKMTHEHTQALKAAVAEEKERERQEREAELFAQKNMLKQRYGQAMMQEKEKWQQDALTAMEKERAAWEEEHAESLRMQQDILNPNHPSGVGVAIAAEREKWMQEHSSSLASALAAERERSKQEHATSLQASLAAQRKKLSEEHAKTLAAALSGATGTEHGQRIALTDARAQWEDEMAAEKARWQQEHEAAMLTQKNELKLRYASVLAQEKEKWKNGGQVFTTATSTTNVGSTASTSLTGARASSPQPPAEASKYSFMKRGYGGGGGGGASPPKK